MLYVLDTHPDGGYLLRNLFPIFASILLSLFVIRKNPQRDKLESLKWQFATIGFIIPTIGLSLYMHYGYEIDLYGMYSKSIWPIELFRFLPFYIIFSGIIGFSIGWIIGRNL